MLQKNNIDIKKCVSQTYDGASVMSGYCKGVPSLFSKEVPQAIYIYCYNHRLNLIISDICKDVATVGIFFSIIEKLYEFVSGAATHACFVEVQKKMKVKKIFELKKICVTRWTAQVPACVNLKRTLLPLLVLLNTIILKKNDRSVDAKELLHQIDFTFIFNLTMFEKILTQFKNIRLFTEEGR